MRDKLTMIAALGTGVVVGISGIYLYYKLNRSVTRELNSLAGTIADLRREIEELKTTEPLRSSSSSSTTVFARIVPKRAPPRTESEPPLGEQTSSSSLDDDNDEYFDFTDVEDAESSWTGLKSNEDLARGVAEQVIVVEENHVAKEEPVTPTDSWLDAVDSELDKPGDKEELYFSMKLKRQQVRVSWLGRTWEMSKKSRRLSIMDQRRTTSSVVDSQGYRKDLRLRGGEKSIG